MQEIKKVISFSGGESSGEALVETVKDHPDAIIVFMNTSKECPETLEFVDRVSREFGVDVVWIEAVFDDFKSIGYRITDFENCYKNGEVFEAMIKCYGLPNKAYPHCNRELKVVPFGRFIKDLNLGVYDTVLGIRADEVDRVNAKHKELRLDYVLVRKGITKPMINNKWRYRGFRLRLKGYQGNCNKCWKKSLRKLMTIEEDERNGDTPIDTWWAEMEEEWGDYVPEHRDRATSCPINKITFYRQNLSNKDIIELSKKPFIRSTDDSIVYDFQTSLFEGYDLDGTDGCEESCDILSK